MMPCPNPDMISYIHLSWGKICLARLSTLWHSKRPPEGIIDMGNKRKHVNGMTTVSIRLPAPVAERFHLETLDPFTKKTKYGAKSQIVTRLLIAWLNNEQEKRMTNAQEHHNDRPDS